MTLNLDLIGISIFGLFLIRFTICFSCVAVTLCPVIAVHPSVEWILINLHDFIGTCQIDKLWNKAQLNVMTCAIWYHYFNLNNVKKHPRKSGTFSKVAGWRVLESVFFTFFKLFKWHQIARKVLNYFTYFMILALWFTIACLFNVLLLFWHEYALKYWVGVQRGQSYLMGRRCLFSLGWPPF